MESEPRPDDASRPPGDEPRPDDSHRPPHAERPDDADVNRPADPVPAEPAAERSDANADYFVTAAQPTAAQPTAAQPSPAARPAPTSDAPDAASGRGLGIVGALLLILAAGALVVAALLRFVGASSGPTERDLGAIGATAPATPAAAAEDGYRVWARNPDGTPVRWNPCEPIAWVLSEPAAPPGVEDDLQTAIARVETATGLDFVYEGTTDERPSRDRRPFQPERYGSERWAPVLVAWATPAETDVSLTGNDRAVSVPVAVGDGAIDVFISGQIVFNVEKPVAPGFDDRHGSRGATMMHEFGHLVGLDHVEDPSQLMFAFPGAGPVRFARGDLAGLAELGAAGGCVEVPPPAEVEVVYRDDFGH